MQKSLFILLTIILVFSQTTYSESATHSSLPTGLSYQQGPGSNNSSYGWSYPYGTKLTVNGSSHRNFEIGITTYPTGWMVFRQYDPANSSWTSWKKILSEDVNGNVGIGTNNPSGTLHIRNEGASTFLDIETTSTINNEIRFKYNGITKGFVWSRVNGTQMAIGGGSTYNSFFINTSDGNVGIGTTDPKAKLSVFGSHGDTTFRLSSTGNGSDQPSNLSLWASEPGETYIGAGIGYNVNKQPYYGVIDPTRGASIIRLRDQEIIFSTMTKEGTRTNRARIKTDGVFQTHKSLIVDGTAYAGEFQVTGGIYKLDQIGIRSWNIQASNGNLNIWSGDDLGKLVYKGDSGFEAKKIRVTSSAGADFVFEDDYKLKSLSETEKFIKENKHLPEIPSAKEMKENGLDMSEFQIKLLQKIEELTLHVIELKKENITQSKKIKVLESLQK